MTRTLTALAVTGLLLGACASAGPQSSAASQAPSGVTASNGGGQRQTGGYTGVSIGAGGATATTGSTRGY